MQMIKHYEWFFSELFEKNFSHHTIQSYRHDLNDFIHYLGQCEINGFNQVESRHIEAYSDKMRQEGLSDSTIYRKSCAIRSFYRFLKKRDPQMEDPTRGLDRPKIHRDDPDYLSPEKFRTLIDHIDLESFTGQRDRMILELLYGTGIKIGELTDLECGMFDLPNHLLRLKGRDIPLSKTLSVLIETYLNRIRPHFDKKVSDRFFLNYRGYQLSRQGIWKNIKRYCRIAGMNPAITSHMLRNSYAINRLGSGATLETIQREMGYQKRHSTRFFLHAIDEEV